MAPRVRSPGVRANLFALVGRIPPGRVTTAEALAQAIDVPPRLVATLLSRLGAEERERVPWHRVVAKGGAVGRGQDRERQIALLVREGVMVSPSGIVQELSRVILTDFDGNAAGAPDRPDTMPQALTPGGRSRGMKLRP